MSLFGYVDSHTHTHTHIHIRIEVHLLVRLYARMCVRKQLVRAKILTVTPPPSPIRNLLTIYTKKLQH